MRMVSWTVFFLAVLTVGCAGKGAEAPSSGPLTMEKWKSLPPEIKYEIGTFERLKLGEPKLQDQREWDKFARNVLLPAKKREFPKGMSQK